ncbi:Carotenoid cleavage dioxygenase 7, chloroplastic-like protein [Drosera capensis]
MNGDEGEAELLPHLVQVSINLDPRGHCQKCSVEPLSEHSTRPSDFPAINPEYAATRNTFVGEPVFVPKEPAAEEDGYLFVVEYTPSNQESVEDCER